MGILRPRASADRVEMGEGSATGLDAEADGVIDSAICLSREAHRKAGSHSCPYQVLDALERLCPKTSPPPEGVVLLRTDPFNADFNVLHA